jgi:hypothetical protein
MALCGWLADPDPDPGLYGLIASSTYVRRWKVTLPVGSKVWV